MIVGETLEGRLRLITQNEHAAFAADFLAVVPGLGADWEVSQATRASDRDHLLHATRIHDLGWAELDSAPSVREDGRPHDYLSLPGEERLDLWNRCVEQLEHKQHPAVSALVVQHAIYLLQLSDSTVESQLQTFEECLDRWLDECGWTRQYASTVYHWLQLADAVSLVACGGGARERTLHAPMSGSVPRLGPLKARLETAPDGRSQTLYIDPFPLAGATTLDLFGRFIPLREYASASDLTLSLIEAPFERIRCKVAAEKAPDQRAFFEKNEKY